MQSRSATRLISGFGHHIRSAQFIAMQMLRSSYRRTFLGPIWISINQVIFVIGVGLLFAVILKRPPAEHLAHVAIGATVWGFTSNLIRVATTSIPKALLTSRIGVRPPWFYALAEVIEQVLIFSHTFSISILITIFAGKLTFGLETLYLPLVLVMLVSNGFIYCLWIGPICARFRDVANAVNSALILIGFMVPTFWSRDNLGTATWVIAINPFAWPIEIIRDLLLDASLASNLLVNLSVLSTINCLLGVFVYRNVQSRIGLWT